jgi:hypothetical protein
VLRGIGRPSRPSCRAALTIVRASLPIVTATFPILEAALALEPAILALRRASSLEVTAAGHIGRAAPPRARFGLQPGGVALEFKETARRFGPPP